MSVSSHCCPHCEGVVSDGHPDAPFCCGGCRAARQLVSELGLDEYYALRSSAGTPASLEPRALTWLEPLVEVAEASARDDLARLSLDVQGIQCAACVWLLERLFSRREGAVKIAVNPGAGTLQLYWRPGTKHVAAFVEDAGRFGYLMAPAGGRRAVKDDLTLRMAIAAALAMNTMILSSSFYLGLTPASDPGMYRTFLWVTFALGALSVVTGGSVFVKAAWRAACKGVVHLDLPIAIGVVLAFVGSTWSAFGSDGGAVYFDTLTTFIALMLFGRWLQHRVVQRNRRSLLEDRGVTDLMVRAERDGRTVVVPAVSLAQGDRVVVAPGEMVPVRGVLEAHSACVSLEWINGEPAPRTFSRGAEVPAGAHNRSSKPVVLIAAEAFDASRLYRLLGNGGALEEDETSPFTFLRLIARVYVVVVLLLAATAFALWWHAGIDRALEVTVAVLVVTCPCALGLATPMAIELAESRLLRLGLFVRRHGLLERVLKVRKVVLDKTGTVTLGELRVVDERSLRSLGERERERLLQMSACSNHPKSRAVCRSLLRYGGAPLSLPLAAALEEVPGRGLELRAADGVWRLGSASFASSEGSDDDDVVFSRDGRVLARIALDEALRPEARDELRGLMAEGYALTLLSGDDDDRVQELARGIGLPEGSALGGMSPDDKAAWIRAHDERDTLMIGDGINDALALDAAFCAGTPAIEHPTLPARADFYLVGQRMAPVRALFATARRLRSTLYGNLALASVYNVVTVFLAMAGLMSPLLCAIAMPISSVVVLAFTAHRLGRRPTAASATDRAAPLPLTAEGAPA